jgi:hypothetical protein
MNFKKLQTNSVPSWQKTLFLHCFKRQFWIIWPKVRPPGNIDVDVSLLFPSGIRLVLLLIVSCPGPEIQLYPPRFPGKWPGHVRWGRIRLGRGWGGGRPHNACRGFQVSNVLFSAVFRIRDVYTESRIRFFSISDPRSRIQGQKDSGSRSASKSLSIFNPKNCF